MHKEDLALNNPEWLICDKTQPNQPIKPSDIDEAHAAVHNISNVEQDMIFIELIQKMLFLLFYCKSIVYHNILW